MVLSLVLAAVAVLLLAVLAFLLWKFPPIRASVAEQPVPEVQPEAPEVWLERVLRRRVVVHTKDDMSFEGSLWETTADGVILRTARILNTNSEPTALPGEVFVPRTNVSFVQLDE